MTLENGLVGPVQEQPMEISEGASPDWMDSNRWGGLEREKGSIPEVHGPPPPFRRTVEGGPSETCQTGTAGEVIRGERTTSSGKLESSPARLPFSLSNICLSFSSSSPRS